MAAYLFCYNTAFKEYNSKMHFWVKLAYFEHNYKSKKKYLQKKADHRAKIWSNCKVFWAKLHLYKEKRFKGTLHFA